MTPRWDLDDTDVAMICGTAIAIATAATMGEKGVPIIMSVVTGIFALARGRKSMRRNGGV